MKRKRNNPAQSSLQPAPPLPISTARQWCFRFVALLLPLLVLTLVELGLRATGYGYPTAFFLKSTDNGREMLFSNPTFGWRFFSPAVARAPRPLYLAARKPTGTVRIFVLGESAAMGDPEPAYGFARQLERLLQAHHAGQKIEIVNAAMTAINSHVFREIARDCAPAQGDFWLVYAGNNEVIGPFGAGTVFGRQAPNLATVRAVLAVKKTRLGQLLAQITRSADEPKQWEGLEFFLKWQVAHDDRRLKQVYSSFAANLDDIAELGRRSGATVLLSTMPVNLHDFPPLASVHRAGLTREKLADWQKFFSAGTQAQADGRYEDALSGFRRACDIDDEFAELIYRRAQCEFELNHAAVAETDFCRACDLDALRFRADSRINEIIRQSAQANGIPLVETDKELARGAGEGLFFDHVHLNFEGNYRVALLFAAELEKHWPGGRTNNLPWLTKAQVAQQLAWTEFDERRVGEEMRVRLQQPPFNAQSNFRSREDAWQTTLSALTNRAVTCVSNYQAAVALAPADVLIHAHFARVLEASGDNAGAAAQWSEVSRLLPHSAQGWANLARLARMRGDAEPARGFIREALKQQPDSVETLTESGILHASLSETEAARRDFRSALALQPGFNAARVNLGLLLAGQRDVEGAAREYREALRWQTNNVEARINLANLLTGQGRTAEAKTLYEQAIALEPENAIARYNFGRLLAAENHLREAVTNFQAALQQSPGVGEIHFELGSTLVRLGREQEALGEFAQTVRLKPAFAEAHLNYGVALARSRRYQEAIAEFRETLRLHPQDERAQQMLKRAIRSAGARTLDP